MQHMVTEVSSLLVGLVFLPVKVCVLGYFRIENILVPEFLNLRPLYISNLISDPNIEYIAVKQNDASVGLSGCSHFSLCNTQSPV